MKQLKKSVSFLLTLIMTFTLSITAFAAAEGKLDGGSITINDAVPGGTYKIYQLLYLESYDPDGGTDGKGAYAYKANSSWESAQLQDELHLAADTVSKLLDECERLNGLWTDAAICLEESQKEAGELREELWHAKEALDFARTKDAEIVRLGMELERMKKQRDDALDRLNQVYEG